jgi:hypothetical protein
VHYNSGDATGTLSFIPAQATNGTAVLTLTANDGSSSNNVTSRQITVTVNATRDLPSLTRLANQVINEDSSTPAIPFTLSDRDTPLTSLEVAGSAADPTLVPATNFVFAGTGANRTIKITPALNRFGTTRITIQVRHGQVTNTGFFQLTVLPVNDAPTVSLIRDVVMSEEAVTNISFTVSDPETSAPDLRLSASASNPALLPVFTFNGNGYERTLQLAPAPRQVGTTLVTVRVADTDGATNNTASFRLTVLPKLQVDMTGTGLTRDIVLTWSASAGPTWILQRTTELGSGASWINVPVAPDVQSERYILIVPATGNNSFFRLHR